MRRTSAILATLAAMLVGFGLASVTLVTCSDRGTERAHGESDASRGGSADGARIREHVEPAEVPAPPPPKPPDFSELTITILGDGGTPFAGATVRLVGQGGGALGATDEDGQVRCDARVGALYGVFATAPERIGTTAAAWRQPAKGHAVTATLEPTRTVSGVVVEQDGETPAPTAVVTSSCVVTDGPGGEVALPETAQTDDDGRFVLRGQPRARVAVRAQPTSARQGREATGHVERGRRDASTRLRFGFVATHEIVALDADGDGPLDSRTVVVYLLGDDGSRTVHSMQSTSTSRLQDGDGAPRPVARIHVRPGDAKRVLVHATGYRESDVVELVANPEESAGDRKHVLRLRKGQADQAVVTLQLSAPNESVPDRLRLSWVHGGTWVTASHETTDDAITLHLPPGETRIEIGGASHREGDGSGYLPVSLALDLQPGQATSHEVTLATGGTIHVRARDPEDRRRLPTPRAIVGADGSERRVDVRSTSDARSHLLAISPVEAGTWTLVFDDEDVDPVIVDVRSGEATEVLVR